LKSDIIEPRCGPNGMESREAARNGLSAARGVAASDRTLSRAGTRRFEPLKMKLPSVSLPFLHSKTPTPATPRRSSGQTQAVLGQAASAPRSRSGSEQGYQDDDLFQEICLRADCQDLSQEWLRANFEDWGDMCAWLNDATNRAPSDPVLANTPDHPPRAGRKSPAEHNATDRETELLESVSLWYEKRLAAARSPQASAGVARQPDATPRDHSQVDPPRSQFDSSRAARGERYCSQVTS